MNFCGDSLVVERDLFQSSDGGSIPTSPLQFSVKPIPTEETKDWLLYKHYAHRMPPISHSFGLYDNTKTLQGICTFGMPPNYQEMMAWRPFELLELNRLVINKEMPKNSLSFFVSKCLLMIKKPTVIISYADLRAGHHGYIYQATNWIYTGIGGEGQKIYVMKDGSERHQRHEKEIDMNQVDHIEKTTGKARYYYFCCNKKQKKEMLNKLRFNIEPYPKGDNKRYDDSYKPNIQGILF